MRPFSAESAATRRVRGWRRAAYWEKAIGTVMQSDQLKKDAEVNRWTIELMGHRELPAYLDREVETYRRTLAELGLQRQ